MDVVSVVMVFFKMEKLVPYVCILWLWLVVAVRSLVVVVSVLF